MLQCSLHNRPDVATAIELLATRGLHYLVIVPFMLQLTAEDAEQLIQHVSLAAERHSHLWLLLAEHVHYDRHLLTAIADRVNELDRSAPKQRRIT